MATSFVIGYYDFSIFHDRDSMILKLSTKTFQVYPFMPAVPDGIITLY